MSSYHLKCHFRQESSAFKYWAHFWLSLLLMTWLEASFSSNSPSDLSFWTEENFGSKGVVETFRDCAECPLMVNIAGGDFMMGDLSGSGNANELPVHVVTIQAFAAGVFEVTWDEWDACVADGGCDGPAVESAGGDNGWGRATRPAVEISWQDAQDYAAWLSARSGKTYRLLTESEWEYTARGGTTANSWWGDQGPAACDGVAINGVNYDRCNPLSTRTDPVGTYQPNPFGLHDVHGNIREWVQDCSNDDYSGAPDDGSAWLMGNCVERVVRGGSWDQGESNVRSAFRSSFPATDRRNGVGFRVARTQAFAPDLVAFYPFDADLLDASGNGLDPINDVGTTIVPGVLGSGVSLSGVGSHIEIPNPFSGDDAFTVASWVRLDDDPMGSDGEFMILESQGASQNRFSFWVRRDSLTVDGVAGSAANFDLPNGQGESLPLGQWVHVALVFDAADGLTSYINGAVDKRVSGVSGAIDGGRTTIGSRSNFEPSSISPMALDEVRLFDEALSSAEIMALTSTRTVPKPPGVDAGDRLGETVAAADGRVAVGLPAGGGWTGTSRYLRNC